MNRHASSTGQRPRHPARRGAIALAATLAVIAIQATGAAASGVPRARAHRPGSLQVRSAFARARAPRALFSDPRSLFTDPRSLFTDPRSLFSDPRSLFTDPFTSIEPGAPPSVPVGANPSGIAVNAATHTVYVVNQTDDTVSVIDARACNARRLSGCGRALATISLGPGGLVNGPISAVVSPDGGTLYVTEPDGMNEVAVIDAADCNAIRTSGCAEGPVATVATGNAPLDAAEDPDTDTLYVVNAADNTVSLIDGRRCNATQTAGCSGVAPTVQVGPGPLAVAIDPQTHTAYVANVDDDTVSVIDTMTCNAERSADCANPQPVQAVGGAPAAVAVATRTDTVYVDNSGVNFEGLLLPDGNTVSVIDGGSCNGGHPQGCSTVPAPAVAVGGGEDNQLQSLAVDQQSQNVYAVNSVDDTVSVIDGKRCNARKASGCAQPAPSEQTGAEPNAVAVLPSVNTVYTTDAADGAVAVIDDRACTGTHPSGCRPAPAPAVAVAPPASLASAAVDAAEQTAYVIDYGADQGGPFVIDLLNTRDCNAGEALGCPTQPLPNLTPSTTPDSVAVDPSTDTLYVSEGDPGPTQLEVIAAASCNATVSSCKQRAIVPLSDGGGALAVDPATHTVYVSGLANVAVVDTRHCNAADLTGCADQTPAVIPFSQDFAGLAVAPNTLYFDVDPNFDLGATGYVGVLDTRHCQAADTTQCTTQTPPTVTVGEGPTAAVLDLTNHTLYVPDNANGHSAGLVSMIDTTHCNGADTSGCTGQIPPTTPVGRSPLGAALDPATNTLYVNNFSDASESVIDTAACNATTLAGCQKVPQQAVVGSGPDSASLDPSSDTMYVLNYIDGTVSLVATGHRGMRPPSTNGSHTPDDPRFRMRARRGG